MCKATEMEDFPSRRGGASLTSMISPCQEGKSSPDALGRSANKSLQVSPARVRASRRWFLLDREPDIHLLSWPRRASQKIELVISCQSRNNSMGASGAYAPSFSRLLTRPGRLRAEEILLIVSPPCYAAVRFSFSTTRKSFWRRSTATKYATSFRATASVARLALPFCFSRS